VKRRNIGWVLAMVALCGGCVEERLVWSPDGSMGALCNRGRLALVRPDASFLREWPWTNVVRAAWSGDGRALVAVRAWPVATWTDLVVRLSADERGLIESLGNGLPELLKSVLETVDGDASRLEKNFGQPLGMELDAHLLAAAMLFVRDKDSNGWAQITAKLHNPNPIELGSGLNVTVFEVGQAALDPVGEWQPWFRSVRPITDVRANPRKPVVAVAQGRWLWAVAAERERGQNATLVSDRLFGTPDWSPDGRHLVYVAAVTRAAAENTIQAGHLQATEVHWEGSGVGCGETTAWLLGLFAFPPRIRVLPSGEVLVPTLTATLPLPMAGPERPQPQWYLIGMSPGSNAALRALPAAGLPMDLREFSVSPRGRRVAVCEAGSDAVAVYDLQSQRVDLVWPKTGAQQRTLPAWRTDEELFFTVATKLPEEPIRWMRWTPEGGVEVWSRRWPSPWLEGLLELPAR